VARPIPIVPPVIKTALPCSAFIAFHLGHVERIHVCHPRFDRGCSRERPADWGLDLKARSRFTTQGEVIRKILWHRTPLGGDQTAVA